MQIAAVGYKTCFQMIKIGETQSVNILLVSTVEALTSIVVKKERYRNRNNPTVELITKVIAHKSKNRLENHDFYQYKQYEKLELDVSNLGKDFTNSKYLKNVNFFFADVDTSKSMGRALIPAYMRETASNIFYRKSPSSRKKSRVNDSKTHCE